jgi:hypothetical protein
MDALLAVDVDTITTVAVVAVVVVVVAMVAVGLLVASITRKVIIVAVLAVLGVALWTQRASLQDCADRVKEAALQPGGTGPTSCTFFGFEVSVDV